MTTSKLVIIVTGASSGIGLTIAQELANDGHAVIGISRGKPLESVTFEHVAADVSDEKQVTEAMASISAKHRRIDVLINCAGIGLSGPLEHTSLAQARKIIDVNVLGAFLMSKHCLPSLRESHGFIINIGSVAGPLTIPFQTFYSISKAALQSLSEGLRLEVKPLGVRVTTVLPGDTKTSFTARREKLPEDAIYGQRLSRSVAIMENDERNGKDPRTVARLIRKLIKRKHPPIAVTVGLSYKFLVFLSRILPKRLVQFIVYQIYGK